EQIGDFGIELSFAFTTMPGQQSSIRRRAYTMIRDVFMANGIEFAQTTVQVGGEEKAAAAAASASTSLHLAATKKAAAEGGGLYPGETEMEDPHTQAQRFAIARGGPLFSLMKRLGLAARNDLRNKSRALAFVLL